MENKKEWKLWYDKPAKEWVEALPLGNGSLGAMVYGEPFSESLQLNEETIWSRGDVREYRHGKAEDIKKLQYKIMDGQLEEAQQLAKDAYIGTPQGVYQTLGNLHLEFSCNETEKRVEGYRRELDLETAVCSVEYRISGKVYRRECFISAADQVLVIKAGSQDGLAAAIKASLSREAELEVTQGELPCSIIMKGFSDEEKTIQYCVALKIIPQNLVGDEAAPASFSDGVLFVGACREAVILLAAATSFQTEDPEKICLERIILAESRGFEALKKAHLTEYQGLFERLDFSLEGEKPEGLPTNERLRRMTDGGTDLDLMALYYHYSRYLLISSSRAISKMPANLQGLWNDLMNPPWGSRYTININTQMNYWIAEASNLSECHEPLFHMIDRLREKGRVVARDMYGCRGFVAHHNTNLWCDATPQDSWPSSTYWPMGAAWLCLHLWDRYEYSKDLVFLQWAYPILKEACEFFVDFLIEDHKGRLVTCPSLSPENIYRSKDGHATALCAGPTMDSEIIRKLFGATVEAARQLELDQEFIQVLSSIMDRLPGLEIGTSGTVMEWSEEYEEVEKGHRHISHLFALYPSDTISVERTPELARAARRTLEERLSNGGGHTGWSCAWIINMWARLYDGENAWKYLKILLSKSTYPNLFDAHPPFQIDGNFGAAAGINEMLLQSHLGVLHFLPALPELWKTGQIRGLRARGNYLANLSWEEGELKEATILGGEEKNVAAGADGNTVTVQYRNLQEYSISCQGQEVAYLERAKDTAIFPVEPGKEYRIKKQENKISCT